MAKPKARWTRDITVHNNYKRFDRYHTGISLFKPAAGPAMVVMTSDCEVMYRDVGMF